MLDFLKPYLSTIKLVVLGVAAAAVVGLVVWAVWTVDSWHEASLALPQVTQQRDAAIVAKDALDKSMTGKFDYIAGQIEVLQKKYAAMETALGENRQSVDAAVSNFKKATANVSTNAASGSADDMFVRDGLLKLLANPDSGSLTRAPGGGVESRPITRLPPAAAPAHNLPGRPGADQDQQGLLVPAAGIARRSGQKRTAQGRRSRSHRLGAEGNGRKVSAQRMGPAVSDCLITVCGPGRYRKVTDRALVKLAKAAVAKLHG